MKNYLLIIILVTTVIPSIAQEEHAEEKEGYGSEIKTLHGNGCHAGGFVGLSFKQTDFNDKMVVMTAIRGGWIINRALAIGIEGSGLIPTAQFDEVLPGRRGVLMGGYGGLFIEPILFSNQVVHVTFPMAGGAGWLGLHDDWEENNDQYEELIDDDVFWYVEPGVALEVNVTRHFRLCFGMSRRFTQDLKLLGTNNEEFEDLNYFMTLKFGRF